MHSEPLTKKYQYDYPMPAVASTVVIFIVDPKNNSLGVLLGIRSEKSDAFPGFKCLPGGFLEVGKETCEETAVRETKEETNIEVHPNDLHLFHVASGPNTDPRYHVVNVNFWILRSHEELLSMKASDDISKLEIHHLGYFDSKEFDIPTLAFDHSDILQRAISSMINVVTVA